MVLVDGAVTGRTLPVARRDEKALPGGAHEASTDVASDAVMTNDVRETVAPHAFA